MNICSSLVNVKKNRLILKKFQSVEIIQAHGLLIRVGGLLIWDGLLLCGGGGGEGLSVRSPSKSIAEKFRLLKNRSTSFCPINSNHDFWINMENNVTIYSAVKGIKLKLIERICLEQSVHIMYD